MRCPDCSVAVANTTLHHHADCPLGKQLDARTEADHEYFLANPGVDVAIRPMEPAEARNLKMLGYPVASPDNWYVSVRKLSRRRLEVGFEFVGQP